MRDQFAVELGKRPKARIGAGSKWQYFSQLLFLKDVVKARPFSGNLSVWNSTVEESGAAQTEGEVKTLSVAAGTSSNDREEEAKENAEPKRKRSRKEEEKEVLLDIERQKLQCLLQKAERREKAEDDDLLFFKSLISMVKRIPDHMKLRFRNHVMSLVDQYAFPVPRPSNDSI